MKKQKAFCYSFMIIVGLFNKIGFFYTCLNFDHVKNGFSDVFYKTIILGKSLKKPIREKMIKKFLIYISVHPWF